MDDRNIAGEQIGELSQEQRRPQTVHQPFVEKAGSRIAFCGGVQNRDIDRQIALAAGGRDDHVHPAQDFLVALDACGIQRQPGGIGPDPLPGFHLTLVALLGDLRIEVYRRKRMDDAGRERFLIDVDAARIERFPMRIQPFAERGRQTDAGDPDFRRSRTRGYRFSHERWPAAESRCVWPSRPRTAGMRLLPRPARPAPADGWKRRRSEYGTAERD